MTGLSAHTLRYHERIGLVGPVARGAGNQRLSDVGDLAWLAFLQRLRVTGMPIRDMRRFAHLRRSGEATIRARRLLLEGHRDEVPERIAGLQRNLAALTEKITHYQGLEQNDATYLER